MKASRLTNKLIQLVAVPGLGEKIVWRWIKEDNPYKKPLDEYAFTGVYMLAKYALLTFAAYETYNLIK
jgi:hypothetical protein